MSSPLARLNKRWMERAIVRVHQNLSHGHRISCLSRQIAKVLLRDFPNRDSEIMGIDIGCGDMRIAESIGLLDSRINWECLDLYELPSSLALSADRWKKYKKFDGCRIDRSDETADFALFTDVLHHVPDDKRLPLLLEARRVAKFVVVKDHFEYGFFSRHALRFMDIVGNWGYGVSIPSRYFTPESFQRLCDDAGLRVVSLDVGIDLYSHLRPLNRLLRPKWQFIAVLVR